MVAPLAADHLANQEIAVDPVVDVVGADELAILQDGDAVGNGEDLGEAMGDIQDRHTMRLQAADDGEELVDLARAEDRGRLVQNQDLGVEREGASDFCHLPPGGAVDTDRPAHVEIEVDAFQNGLGVAVEPVPVDQPSRWFAAAGRGRCSRRRSVRGRG